MTVAIAPARPASTVVVLRATAGAPEILMVRRHRASTFMADAHVFPGGRVEPQDGAPADDASFARAAARELAEEAGVHVPVESLIPFARWVTPSAEPKRFDAHFFVAPLPAGQVAHDEQPTAGFVETTGHLWATAADLVARHHAGELKLPPPTLCNLGEMSAMQSVDAVLSWARARANSGLSPIQPKLVPDADGALAIVLPWDPAYASLPGEGEPFAAGHPAIYGPSRFVLREGRWWAPRPQVGNRA